MPAFEPGAAARGGAQQLLQRQPLEPALGALRCACAAASWQPLRRSRQHCAWQLHHQPPSRSLQRCLRGATPAAQCFAATAHGSLPACPALYFICRLTGTAAGWRPGSHARAPLQGRHPPPAAAAAPDGRRPARVPDGGRLAGLVGRRVGKLALPACQACTPVQALASAAPGPALPAGLARFSPPLCA